MSPSDVPAGPLKRKCLFLASTGPLSRKNNNDDESTEVCLARESGNKSANQVKITTVYKTLAEYLILAIHKQQKTQL